MWKKCLGVFAAVVVLGLLSQQFVFPPYWSAAVWLPAGFTLAVVARSPRSQWLWLLIAILVAQVILPWAEHPLALILATVGSILRTVVGALLVRYWESSRSLLREVRMVVGVGLAAIVAPVFSASFATFGVVQEIGTQLTAGEVWLSWYLSDLLGILLVAPLVIAWWPPLPPLPGQRVAEISVAVVMALLVTQAVYGDYVPATLQPIRGNLWVPIVAWMALRGGARSVSFTTLATVALALWNTAQGRGPHSQIDLPLNLRVLTVQQLFAFYGLFALLLSSARTEKQRAYALQRSLVKSGELLSESLDYRLNFGRLGQELVPGVAAGFAIWVIPAGELNPRLVTSAGLGEDALFAFRRQQAEGVTAWAFSEGAAVLVSFRGREQLRGVLGMSFGSYAHLPDSHERAAAQQLAQQCALALQSAQLYAKAQDAIALRDQFLAAAAHELRTPLTATRLRLNRLEKTIGDGSDATHVQLYSVRRAVKRLQRIVENLLQVGFINTGTLKLRREEIDVGSLADEVCEDLSADAARAGCELQREGQRHLLAWVDGARMKQVIQEMLSNAMKFGAGRPVVVAVFLEPPFVRIEVTDQGIGVHPEDIPRIFGRFERAASGRNIGGLGLGLFIAQKVAEAHGGSVEVQSIPGERTTFRLWFPQTVDATLDLPVEARAGADASV